jgi:hypothetical protein
MALLSSIFISESKLKSIKVIDFEELDEEFKELIKYIFHVNNLLKLFQFIDNIRIRQNGLHQYTKAMLCLPLSERPLDAVTIEILKYGSYGGQTIGL